jgi:hypothetical protein
LLQLLYRQVGADLFNFLERAPRHAKHADAAVGGSQQGVENQEAEYRMRGKSTAMAL